MIIPNNVDYIKRQIENHIRFRTSFEDKSCGVIIHKGERINWSQMCHLVDKDLCKKVQNIINRILKTPYGCNQ